MSPGSPGSHSPRTIFSIRQHWGFPDTPPAQFKPVGPDQPQYRSFGLGFRADQGSSGRAGNLYCRSCDPTRYWRFIRDRVKEAAGGLGPPFGNLFTIDRNTGVATLVGSTGLENASLAFAPNGTLYATSAAVNPDDPFGPLIEVQIETIDPATGRVLTAVPTSMFYAALAFDGTNGLLVGGTGSGNSLVSGDIFTIDPATGNQIAHVSDTGLDFIGDLDFRPVPEPASLTLVGLGVAAIFSRLHSRIR
jgi:hypothetical protein